MIYVFIYRKLGAGFGILDEVFCYQMISILTSNLQRIISFIFWQITVFFNELFWIFDENVHYFEAVVSCGEVEEGPVSVVGCFKHTLSIFHYQLSNYLVSINYCQHKWKKAIFINLHIYLFTE